mgnify:CR=1 FL=1
MSKSIQMPALSPTMEEGTLAKWLVKEGDTVVAGDLIAEIETDKATMEFEAVDEGTIAKILVAEGTNQVKVGTVIAMIAEEGEDVAAVAGGAPAAEAAKPTEAKPAEKTPAPNSAQAPAPAKAEAAAPAAAKTAPAPAADGRVRISPLARRLAETKGVDLASLTGSGPNGRIVKADLEGAKEGVVSAPAAKAAPAAAGAAQPAAAASAPAIPSTGIDFGIPNEVVKLSGMRKTIARRLTESKQQVPHIYLTVDIQLDKLLALRGELNAVFADRKVTLHHNYYKKVHLRVPMYRGATGHFFNNYVVGATDASEIRANTCVRLEKNYYESLHYSIYTSSDSVGKAERIDNIEVMHASRAYPADCKADIPYTYAQALTTTTTNDNRSYHVSSRKIYQKLGWKPRLTIEDAVRGLCAAFKDGRFRNTMSDESFINVKVVKKLGLK